MTLNNAKGIAKNIIAELEKLSFDDISNDGYDSDDQNANTSFSFACAVIDDCESRLADIDIDGIEDYVLNEMWSDCFCERLPESRYNRNIEYAHKLLALKEYKDYDIKHIGYSDISALILSDAVELDLTPFQSNSPKMRIITLISWMKNAQFLNTILLLIPFITGSKYMMMKA